MSPSIALGNLLEWLFAGVVMGAGWSVGGALVRWIGGLLR